MYNIPNNIKASNHRKVTVFYGLHTVTKPPYTTSTALAEYIIHHFARLVKSFIFDVTCKLHFVPIFSRVGVFVAAHRLFYCLRRKCSVNGGGLLLPPMRRCEEEEGSGREWITERRIIIYSR